MRGAFRGFLVGSFALIVTYTVLQDNVAKSLGIGSNLVTEAIKRWMGPETAAVPDRSRSLTTAPTTPTKPSAATPLPAPNPGGIWV